jgi:hypothetical protein
MKRARYIILIAGCLLANAVCLLAQRQKELAIDGGLYGNSSNVALHFSVSENWLFNPNFGVSAGAMFLLAPPLDVAEWSDAGQTNRYSVDDNNVWHLNIILSAFYMRPLIRNTGIYGNGSFLFEPVPFDYISVEKRAGNDWYQVPEERGKLQYSGFSPGAFAEAGLFHDFKAREGKKGLRVFVGFGYGWYDMYAAFRRATIDGQKLSTQIRTPLDNYYKRITIKLMGI